MNLPTDPTSNAEPAAAPFSFTCPSLGMLDDRTTVTLFPTEYNLCFHCKQPTAPNAAHQTSYCLSQKFADCELKQDENGNLPESARWPVERSVLRASWLRTAGALGIALLLALFFILWLPGIISDLMMTFAPTPVSGGSWPTLTPSPTSEPALLAQAPILAPTLTPIPTEFAAPTASPARREISMTVALVDNGVNCRAGPGTAYASLVLLSGGEALEPLGRDEANTFYAVSIPEQNISECWIAQSLVDVEGDPGALPVLTPTPAP